ncbi:MAG TPA: hypothetical protein VK779_00865 [Rhizomicrobium sp.]|jgi:hypothetical protein|nr:hypothetical protein [Rhizomicrobium sp.]
MSSALEEIAPSEGDSVLRIDMRGFSAVLERVDVPGLLERGCVNVIGIEPVQDKLGARWPRMQAHIHERVQKYIARRLTSSEYYAPISDVQYVISMPGEDAQSAQLRSFHILEEVLTTLVGRFAVEQVRIGSVVGVEGNYLVTQSVDAVALANAASANSSKSADAREGVVVPFLPPRARTIQVGEKELHLQFAFRPVWDLRREAISSFGLQTIVETNHSRPRDVKIERVQHTDEEVTAIDIATAEHGRDVLNYLLERQTRFILHIPCTYETLANTRTRARFLELLKKLSSDQRRYVVYELTALPIGVPQSRISDLAAMLRPFGRGVIAAARPNRSELLTFQGCGLNGLALNLDELQMRENEMFERIGLFRDIGQLAGDQLIAYGVTSRSLAIACWALGLSHMSGPVIASAVPIPRQMHRFSARDLYRN